MADQIKAEKGPTVDGIKAQTEKTYTVFLGGAEPRPWPYSTTRIYRPARLVVVKRDGNVVSVELTGPQVKKDGTDGGSWTTERFYGRRDWPAWFLPIIGGLA